MPERRWRVMGRGRSLFAFDVDDSGGSARRRRPRWTPRCVSGSVTSTRPNARAMSTLTDDFRCTWWR